ncbi:hypothetical protein E3N88_06149 [Mikania micrantha]|uniref:Uncharacterized protein n=1 Tax=Mikania micrantha TaxID=192012 RepID=A0A5N6PMZ1_9ASTR|nr:hypothetical protein E3N88_06149 [Mikania micrantha]
MQRFSGLEIHHPYEQLATIQQSDSIHDDIDDFVAGKDVEGTLHHDSIVSKGSLSCVRCSNELGPVYKNGLSGVGQAQPNSSFSSLPSDNGEGELVWWEADTSLDQGASGMKVTHEEHSVMLQDLSTTHSNKGALKFWHMGSLKYKKYGLIRKAIHRFTKVKQNYENPVCKEGFQYKMNIPYDKETYLSGL